MRRWIIGLVVLTLGVSGFALAGPPSASAVTVPQKLHFAYGPIHVKAGQNIIQFSGGQVPKPKVDGWIVGITPNLILPDNTVPPVDVLHLHHAVWINQSRTGRDVGRCPSASSRSGEEKTQLLLPTGYGYKYRASDRWLLNYMIHDLVDRAVRRADHVRHHVHPGQEHQAAHLGDPDLDGRAERFASIRSSTCTAAAERTASSRIPTRRTIRTAGGARTSSRCRPAARSSRPAATSIRAVCGTTCTSTGAGGPRTSSDPTRSTSSRPVRFRGT